MDFPWMDARSIIKGSLRAWRDAFPAASTVNVSELNKDGSQLHYFAVGRREPMVDSDFVHIQGDVRARLHTVNIMCCSGVTDAAFMHLRGIHMLSMACCNQLTITDAVFMHLRGIQRLSMSFCIQTTITDAAFLHLHGIQTLRIGEGFLGFLTMRASNALRGLCREFREAVIDFPWMDTKSWVGGSVEAWGAAFPAARAVNVEV